MFRPSWCGFHEEIMETWTTLTPWGPTPQSYARFKNCGEPQHFSRPSCKMAILHPTRNTTTKGWKMDSKSSFTSKDSRTDSRTLVQTNDFKDSTAKSSIKANRICESILSCLLGCQPDSAFFFQLTNTCHRHKSPSLSKCHGVQSTLPSNIAWEPGLVHVMCRQHLSEVSFSEPLAVTNHALGVPTVTRPCFIDRRSSHTARREKGSRPLVGSSKTTSRDPPRKAMPFGPVGALQKFQEVNPYRLPTKLYCSF